MKVLFSFILSLIILTATGVAAFYFAPETVDKLLYYSVCNQPIKYRVDTVDPEFNLPRDEFLSNINQAGQIWNNALGKELFMYDPKGDLSINLIYDERQSLTNQINNLESTVKSEKQSLNPKINEFRKQSLEFKQKVDNLNKEIGYWNNQGGAPPEEYQKILTRQQELKTEGNRLNTVAQTLNVSANEYNSQITELNKTIKFFNSTLEDRPEEGIFKGPEYSIEIYFNINKDETVHTLAHELGHALGLKHAQDPQALMYYKTHQGLDLSSTDLAALKEICQKHSILKLYQNYLNQLLIKYKLILIKSGLTDMLPFVTVENNAHI